MTTLLNLTSFTNSLFLLVSYMYFSICFSTTFVLKEELAFLIFLFHANFLAQLFVKKLCYVMDMEDPEKEAVLACKCPSQCKEKVLSLEHHSDVFLSYPHGQFKTYSPQL